MLIKKSGNNTGFSLVEIMVVLGLLGGLSLVVMNLTKQTSQSSTKYQFDSEILLITNEINGIISDPHKCLTTFTNATQAASPATPTIPTANVLNPTGIASIPSSVRKYTIAGGPYGNGAVKISNYSLDLAAIPDPLLTINFQKKGILGVGTIPKTIRLYVEKNGSGVITMCRSLSSASVDIWSRGTGTNIYYSNNVGIGTSSPTYPLTVQDDSGPAGGMLLQGNNIDGPNIRFKNSANNTWSFDAVDATNSRFRLITEAGASGNQERLSILETGNVGIGLPTPLAKLHVAGGTPSGENIRLSSNSSTEGGQLSLMDGTGAGAWEIDNYGVDGSEQLRIYRDKGEANVSGAVVISSTGNVGIGTAAPASKLDVVGGVKMSGDAAPCTAAKEGTQRYNATSKKMEFCNGTVWAELGGGGGTDVAVYQCPSSCNAGCSGGAWGFYGCMGQITVQSTCRVIEWGSCNNNCACTYLGKMKVYP